jgi:hypothetical protein
MLSNQNYSGITWIKMVKHNKSNDSHYESTKTLKTSPKGRKKPIDSKKKLNKSKWFLQKTQVNHLLKWLARTLFVDQSLLQHCRDYICFIIDKVAYNGIATAFKINKEIRLRVQHNLANITLYRNESKVSLTYDGLPVILGDIIKFMRTKNIVNSSVRNTNIKFILSCLNFTRLMIGRAEPDIANIIGISTCDIDSALDINFPPKLLNQFKNLLRRNTPKRKYKKIWSEGKELNTSFCQFHASGKKGPTGLQSLVSVTLDGINLPTSLVDSIEVIGGSELGSKLKLVRENSEIYAKHLKQPLVGKPIFRKLNYIADKEGKTRVIAAGDYWSQTALRTLHSNIYDLLAVLPNDQTFNQGEGLEHLLSKYPDQTFYSFDLSAFTDRFPIKLIKKFVTVCAGEEISSAWHNIMVGYPFVYNDPNGETASITYEVGNPMGFYTSWGLSTMCHHLVLYACCKKLKINFITAPYKLLGDDIVIFNDDLAREYQKLINILGVEINFSKSFISKGYFEFAKRIFIPGKEISPFPLGSVNDSIKSITCLIEMIYSARRKGFDIPDPNHTALTFSKLFFRGNKKFLLRLEKGIKRAIYLNKIFNRLITPQVLINDIIDEINERAKRVVVKTLGCNHEQMSKDILSGIITIVFSENSANLMNIPEDMIYNLILECSSFDMEGTVAHAHPYVSLAGILHENEYINQMKDALYYDTTLKGSWPINKILFTQTDLSNLFLGVGRTKVHIKVTPILIRKLFEELPHLY